MNHLGTNTPRHVSIPRKDLFVLELNGVVQGVQDRAFQSLGRVYLFWNIIHSLKTLMR